jgi:hypothetical protein
VRPPDRSLLAAAGLGAALLDMALAGLVAIIAVDRWAPPQDLPWKPLRLADPIGWATTVKLDRAASDPALCRAILRDGGVSFVDVPETRDGRCAIRDGVRLSQGVVPLSPRRPTMTCRLALAYSLWDRQVVRPAAREELGGPVLGVEHYGTYACRNIYGRAEGRLSQHALADAIDVAGFRLADGRRITVARDFRRDDARGRFLRRVRDGACDPFRGVLSPDYNAAHQDHLHLDFGRYRICR